MAVLILTALGKRSDCTCSPRAYWGKAGTDRLRGMQEWISLDRKPQGAYSSTMKTATVSAVFFLLLVVVSSCGKPKLTLHSSPSVVGHLEHRNGVVTIKSGEQGTLYSGKDKQGKTLFENLTAEQLKAQSPEIYELIDPAKLGTADRLGL